MADNEKSPEIEVVGDTEVLERDAVKLKRPSFYQVVLLNDDFTPRDFVIHILQKFFDKTEASATQIMLHVHHKGRGIAGVYPFETAETKAYQVNQYSRAQKYPLKCTLEKA